jgi:hypothetical protein
MNNIVDFRTGPARPRRSIPDSEDGARILFFTGVRYSRDPEDHPEHLAGELALLQEASGSTQKFASEAVLDLAAH